jgi:hypothetical protein
MAGAYRLPPFIETCEDIDEIQTKLTFVHASSSPSAARPFVIGFFTL